MALEKLIITPLSKLGIPLFPLSIKVLFNPNEYTISKSVAWGAGKKDRRFNASGLTFGGGDNRELTLKLFYDVTEANKGLLALDVRRETNKLVALTRINRYLERPPVVMVTWGIAPIFFSDFPFFGVITSLRQNFVLFSANGRPLRANVDVTLLEYLSPEMDKRQTDPELTTYRIKRGDRVANISAEMYGDPTQWRRIVEANGLDDPRNLDIGKVLSVPDIS
jgi:Contractile injection system tube protein/LysM domain